MAEPHLLSRPGPRRPGRRRGRRGPPGRGRDAGRWRARGGAASMPGWRSSASTAIRRRSPSRRARLGDERIQLPGSPLRLARGAGGRRRPFGRTSFCSTSGSPPANWTRRHADLLSVRVLHSTCGWSGRGASAADLLNRLGRGRPGADLRRLRRRAAGAPSRARDRPAAGAAPFAISDDLVNADPRDAGATAGPSDFARLFQAVRIAVNDELGRASSGRCRRFATRWSRAGAAR